MREVDAAQTSRAAAFKLWMNAPMPMVTLFKTFDVTKLVTLSRRRGCKFNMLLCWCISKAASQTEEFYLLPVDGKLMQFDSIAVSTVVATAEGGISTCDIPFSENLQDFQRDYLSLTEQVRKTGQPHNLDSHMVIGTSALVTCDMDGAVNIYAGCYNNPFLIWGKYRKKGLKRTLPISFQFHHTQLDGGQAAQFLEHLQAEIKNLSL